MVAVTQEPSWLHARQQRLGGPLRVFCCGMVTESCSISWMLHCVQFELGRAHM